MVSSVTREMIMSIQPPKYPAAAPHTTPRLIEIAVAKIATSSDARPPYSSRRNSSRPCAPSLPSGKNTVGKLPVAPMYGTFAKCDHGPRGSAPEVRPPSKIWSGPCPRIHAKIGAPTKHSRIRTMTVMPPPTAALSFFRVSQTDSQ